jgi:hypothetical protein
MTPPHMQRPHSAQRPSTEDVRDVRVRQLVNRVCGYEHECECHNPKWWWWGGGEETGKSEYIFAVEVEICEGEDVSDFMT